MDTSIVVPLHAHSAAALASDAQQPEPRPSDRLASRSRTARKPAAPATHAASRDEVARLQARVRELAAELTRTQEATRRQVAHELHDSVGAELTAARFALAGIETWLPADAPAQCATALATAQRSLDAVTEAAQHAVADLHAPTLDKGIVNALSHWTHSFAARTGLRMSFVCAADARLTRLSADASLAVFRVAQEALNNVAKHARAAGADMRIETTPTHLSIVVSDDGIGIPPHAGQDERQFGLAGMRARCNAFDGELRIAAASARQPRGTTVQARFAWKALLGNASRPRARRTAIRL
ncbi:Histidine kinase [Paraburkholderia piptadeniae]|uniref:histidine kinase n=1 Tax=Paraburkholderia piptadeniae TaxID=1701573 RepID=A0A1N7RIY9_9BURK|nr:ATP-binding protein [Paraburkholderia piptadeniae]SIT35080.1 Histidine kinase [Paraburkholderia piptadeniae]